MGLGLPRLRDGAAGRLFLTRQLMHTRIMDSSYHPKFRSVSGVEALKAEVEVYQGAWPRLSLARLRCKRAGRPCGLAALHHMARQTDISQNSLGRLHPRAQHRPACACQAAYILRTSACAHCAETLADWIRLALAAELTAGRNN